MPRDRQADDSGTNILIYAIDLDAGERHARAKDIVGRSARCDCVLTIQVLSEFFHATIRKNLIDPGKADTFVRGWLDVFPVVSANDMALVDAMDAVAEHRLPFWDAMLWAAARQAGCAVILSEDMQDGRRLSGVEIVNPFAMDAEARLVPLLEA